MTPSPRINRSLLQDLERRLGTADLVDWLETQAERVANLGRGRSGRVDFTRSLLRDRSITKISAELHLPALATIRWQRTGYEIAYAAFSRRIEDQRFAIAHEIAHTFWFAPERGMEPLSPLQRALGDDPTIEWLCNRAAAAILLPRSDVLEIAQDAPRILHHVPRLAKRYLVPERLVARRVFHDLCVPKEFFVAGIRADVERSECRRIAWFASPLGARATKSVDGRVIPEELLPDVPVGETTEAEVDGRWWALIESLSTRSRAKPLKHSSAMPSRAGWVARTTESWYIAIPR